MASKFILMIVLIFVLFCHAIQSLHLQSVCELAVDPESCHSSLLQNPNSSKADHKELTKISVEMCLAQVEEVYDLIPPSGWVISREFDAKSSRAIDNCLTFYDLALDYLKEALSKVTQYSEAAASSLKKNDAADIQTLLNAALTSQQICLQGLQQANVNVTQFTFATDIHNASRSVSNSLALVNKLWNIAGNAKAPRVVHQNRRLLISDHGDNFGFDVKDDFPSWLSGEYRRRLLRSSEEESISANVVVAQDGSGNHRRIQDAINSAPNNSPKTYVIHVKLGLYKENVLVPKSKTNIMLVGDGMDNTVITGTRSVVDGWLLTDTGTLIVLAKAFMARDITIQNTAGPQKMQAVAVMMVSDFAVLHRCKLIGFQDTLYTVSLRQLYTECDIYGTIDFICGNAAAIFQKCNIVVRKPLHGQQNVITAQQRSEPNQNTAIVIDNCKVYGSAPTYLGRPWGMYSRTVYIQTYLDGIVNPKGWLEWPAHATTSSIYYGEYRNNGAGAATSQRVRWPGFHLLHSSDVQQFTVPALYKQ